MKEKVIKMDMEKLDKLLEALYELGKEDGFKEHQFDCAEDDYDGELWFEWLEEIAKEYNVSTDGYDGDAWENASCLNYNIRKQIITEIKKELDERKGE